MILLGHLETCLQTEGIRGRLICEGRTDERFFRKLLEPIFGKRLDVKISPSGEGSASAWVLKQYPHHVRDWVRRAPTQNVALVVAVDGDAVGTSGRMAQAAQALLAAGEATRGPRERIAICTPTWSIETWLLFLAGEPDVGEAESLKTRFERGDFDFDALAKQLRESQNSALPSIQAGIVELNRVRP